MKRALYERIVPFIDDLPRFYRVNVPDLCATTSPETRQATKAHDYSVNWIVGQGQPEIVNASTGKTINEATSRISKKCCRTSLELSLCFSSSQALVSFSVFSKFLRVSASLFDEPPFTSPCRYSEAKKSAVQYQEAKQRLIKALEKTGCGHWIEKPVEQDQFSM